MEVAPNCLKRRKPFLHAGDLKVWRASFASSVDVLRTGFLVSTFALRVLLAAPAPGFGSARPANPAGQAGRRRGSELAAVVDEGPGRTVQGLAGRKGHLTAAVPVYRRVVQADPLRLKHLPHRSGVLLLAR